MAFLLNGQPLAVDTPFTDASGTQYPANWLRLSTQEEKKAIGITEVPDAPIYDQRFYWGYDADGKLIPKDHAELVQQWADQTFTTAGLLLASTDWQVIREMDNGKPMNPSIKSWREAIRLTASSKAFEIKETTDTDALAIYVTAPAYSQWPKVSTDV